MDKELALRTFGYLFGHYKTHEETIINSQEIEAIEFILKNNENLKQQCKKQKEVVDKAETILNGCKLLMSHEFDWEEQVDNVLDILKEVSE